MQRPAPALRSWLRREVLPSIATREAFSGQLSRTQCGEGGGEERGVDPVHQDGEPALAGDAVRVGQVPAEEVEVRRAPGGDVLVVVAVGDGAADHEQEDLVEPVGDPPHVARVLDLGEVLEQGREARLPGQGLGGRDHGRLQFRAAASIQRKPSLSPVI